MNGGRESYNGSDPRGADGENSGDGAFFPEAPRPLMRDMPQAEPFPIDALPDFLRRSILSISDQTQTDPALAAQSVLAVATQAAQPLIDVVMPGGIGAVPVSNFFLTVAESGERKTGTSRKACEPIVRRERDLRQEYDAAMQIYSAEIEAWNQARQNVKSKVKGSKDDIKVAILEIGAEPKKPLYPYLTSSDVTVEGLIKTWPEHHPALGIVNTEGGAFLSGHGFTAEKVMATGANLSNAWGGQPIRRIRAGDGITSLDGRRLSMDIQIQPDAAVALYANPILRDQGLLARFLPVYPASRIGTRMMQEVKPETLGEFYDYVDAIGRALRIPYRTTEDGRGALTPYPLPLTDDAQALWGGFANAVELAMRDGAEYADIRGLASKLPEHAARLAAVIELVCNGNGRMPQGVTPESMSSGIRLAQHYATEAMRLFAAGKVSPDLDLAGKVWRWIETSWREPFIHLPALYQLGPTREIRERAKAYRIAEILDAHGYLSRMPKGAIVGGTKRKEAWAVYGKMPGSGARQ